MSRETYKSKAERSVERRWLSVAEAAHYLGVTPITVRRMIARGDLRGFRLKGVRAVRVDRREIDKLMQPIPAAEAAAAVLEEDDVDV